MERENPVNIYLSHYSALAAYENGRLPAFFTPGEKALLPEGHIARLSAPEAAYLHERFSLPYPIQTVVCRKENRRNSMLVDSHVLVSPQMRSEFHRVDKGLFIASPKLALLQVANDLSLLDLTLLISRFASRFAVRTKDQRGFAERDQLCTLEGLALLANDSSRTKGLRSFREALSLATEGARSPAELKFAMRLALSNPDFGGYALPKPLVNAFIDLSATGNSLFGKREVDFLWPEARLVVQYDSIEEHTGTLDGDARRDNEVTEAGYHVVRATAGQTAAPASMNALAASIAKFVYAQQSPEQREAVRQAILFPSPEEQAKRNNLKTLLDQHFSTDICAEWAIRRQQEKGVSRNRANNRRRTAYSAKDKKTALVP